MRAENGVYAIDVHVKHLIDPGSQVFVEPESRLTEVEAPDENEASEHRHEEWCCEAQNMSDDEGRSTWCLERRRQERSPSMPCHTCHTVAGASTASEEEAEASSPEQTVAQSER